MPALCGYACWRDRASPVWRHGTCTAPGEVVHFDSLYVGSNGPEGSEGLPEEDGFRYILIMDDFSNFVSLEPAEACKAEVTAKHLLNWCKTMGVPRLWVSGQIIDKL